MNASTVFSKPAKPDRLPMLDVARLIAAIGVIAAHVIDEFFPGNPAWMFGSFAVPFYLFVAIYFTVRGLAGDPHRPVGPYLLGRVKRVYLPFLLWNVIYDVFHVLRHRGDAFTPPLQMLWAAVYTHLYFLPFLFVVTAIVAMTCRPVLARRWLLSVVASALVILAIAIAFGPQPTSLADAQNIQRETLWNFYRAIPPACLAIAAALVVVRTRWTPRTSISLAIVGALLTVTCLAIEVRFGQQGLLRAGSGLGLAMVAFCTFRARRLTPLAALGRLSFGVYLSHILVIRIVMAAVDHAHWPHDARVALLVGGLALIGGLAISSVLASSRFTRWMIGCEPAARRRLSEDHPAPSSELRPI